ncbi:MAG: hypothetical protein Q4B65_01355 [Candidatus Saccharibacteria bacterium]|nr:hypothetical protein [Candidatus Saccharibacteria bacterium]
MRERKRSEKSNRGTTKRRFLKIVGLAILGVGVAAIVVIALIQYNRYLAFSRAEELTGQILGYEGLMQEYFSGGTAEDLGDVEKIEALELKGEELFKIVELTNELRGNEIVCAEGRLAICDEIGVEVAKFTIAFKRSEALLSWLETGEIVEEDLNFLSEDIGKLAEVMTEFRTVRTLVQEFKEKYPAEVEIDETTMIVEYGELLERMEEISAEAEGLTFEEIYGTSKEGIMRIFEVVRNLRNEI